MARFKVKCGSTWSCFLLLQCFPFSLFPQDSPCPCLVTGCLLNMRLCFGLTGSFLSWREVKRDSGFCEVEGSLDFIAFLLL